MKVIKLVSNNYFSSNTYILENSNNVLIVDLGFYDSNISTVLKKYNIVGVILTHKHFDHIQGLEEFQKEYPNVKIYTKENSDEFFINSELNCSKNMSINGELDYKPFNLVYLKEGNVRIGNFNMNIIYTPGHTSDSITILLESEGILFSGDFIFNNSIGRMDLPTSNRISMINSLTKIVPILKKNNYVIYSGHDEYEISSISIFKDNAYLKRFY